MVRRVPFIVVVLALLMAMAATPVFANIHPIMSSECAAPAGSDVANHQMVPGQGSFADEEAFFSGQIPASRSLLRALIGTGVILVDADGYFAGIDFTRSALHGDSGAAKCPNA